MVYCAKILVRYRYILHGHHNFQFDQKKCLSWGSCRNITFPSYCIAAFLCSLDTLIFFVLRDFRGGGGQLKKSPCTMFNHVQPMFNPIGAAGTGDMGHRGHRADT